MFRSTPSCLYLCGAPGIGKSHLLMHIVRCLNERLYHFNDHRSIVFARTVTTEHWDGYFNQPIVIFDDHYKMVDGEQEIDAREVMNVVSCTNYYPSFAVLHNKGVPFNSHFLIITSNTGWPLTIYLPEALHRRHKLHVIVIKNANRMDVNFSHLDFYLSYTPINLWKGNYSSPFNCTHDIPFNYDEWAIFPYKHLYRKVELNNLIDLLVQDHLHEVKVFNSLNK